MKVKREAVVAAVVALVFTVVLIGAVGAKVVSPLATDEQNIITNLHLSNSCDGDPMVLFPADTETAYLVFDYSEMQGQEMRIAVTGPKFFVEAEHSSVIKSAGWITETWPEAYGEQYVKACGAVNPNATLTSTFRADTISMSYVKDSDGGVAEVQVDDLAPITVDMCATTTTKAGRVITSGLGPELHTITVKVISQTNSCDGSCVGVDRFWNEVILYDATHSYTDAGTECIELTYVGGAIPAGNYTANIYSGGTLPIKTELWHVRPGGPGEIKDLRMSISPGGPSETEFIEGTRTVWAIFDYAGMTENEVGIRVHKEGGSHADVISTGVSLTGSGTKAISATHYLAAGFPVDQYRTHIVKDGFVDGIENWSVVTEGATSTPTPIPATATPTLTPEQPTPTPIPPTATPLPEQPYPTPMPPTPTPAPEQPTPTPIPPTATLSPEQPYPTPMSPTPTPAPEQPTLTPSPAPPMATVTETPSTPTTKPTASPTPQAEIPFQPTAVPTIEPTPMPATPEAGSLSPTPTTALTPKFTPIPTATSDTTEGAKNFLGVVGYVGVAVLLISVALFLWQRRSS